VVRRIVPSVCLAVLACALAPASCASLGTYDGPTSTCLKLQAPPGVVCDGPPRAFRTGEVCRGDVERVMLENCSRGGEKPATVYLPVNRMDCQMKEAPGGICFR
jgi:hypothetical protein